MVDRTVFEMYLYSAALNDFVSFEPLAVLHVQLLSAEYSQLPNVDLSGFWDRECECLFSSLTVEDDYSIFADGFTVDEWVDLTSIDLSSQFFWYHVEEVRSGPSQRECPVPMSVHIRSLIVDAERDADFFEPMRKCAAGRP